MKNPDRASVTKLDALPNVGKAMTTTLLLVGINHPKDLIGKDPVKLYEQLCSITGKRADPCVLDIFISIIHFMEGGDAQPWWFFSKERKRLNRTF